MQIVTRLERENADLRKALLDLLDDKSTTYHVRVMRARAVLEQ